MAFSTLRFVSVIFYFGIILELASSTTVIHVFTLDTWPSNQNLSLGQIGGISTGSTFTITTNPVPSSFSITSSGILNIANFNNLNQAFNLPYQLVISSNSASSSATTNIQVFVHTVLSKNNALNNTVTFTVSGSQSKFVQSYTSFQNALIVLLTTTSSYNLQSQTLDVQIISIYSDSGGITNIVLAVMIYGGVYNGQYISKAKLMDVMMNALKLKSLLGSGVTITKVPQALCAAAGCSVFPCMSLLVGSGAPPSSAITDGLNPIMTYYSGLQYTLNAVCNASYYQSSDCFDGGTKISNYLCNCPTPLSGPRCQGLKHSYAGGGTAYSVHPSLPVTQSLSLSFEFIMSATSGNAILLHAGDYSTSVSVLLSGGFLFLYVNVNSLVNSPITSSGLGAFNNNALNDNKWHRVDLLWTGSTFTLQVDMCAKFGILTKCQYTYSIGSNIWYYEQYNTYLGGIPAWIKASLPTQISSINNLDGCIQNFRVNGYLQDININQVLQLQGISTTQNGCPSENTACGITAINVYGNCGSLGICTGALNQAIDSTCTCLPTVQMNTTSITPTCSINTTTASFGSGASIAWTLNQAFLTSGNLPPTETKMKLQFITYAPNAVLITLISSPINMALTISSSNLVFTFGVISATLSGVNVSDGNYHYIVVSRVQNGIELVLDSGEGPYYKLAPVTSLGSYIGSSSTAVIFAGSNGGTTSSFSSGCMNDFRLGENDDSVTLFSSQISTESAVSALTSTGTISQGCSAGNPCMSNATYSPCSPTMNCTALWRYALCSCPPNMAQLNANTCQTPCDPPNPCQNRGTCQVNSANRGTYICSCGSGFSGQNCTICTGQNISGICVTACYPNNPCQNQGICTLVGNSYNCTCPAGISGANCQNGVAIAGLWWIAILIVGLILLAVLIGLLIFCCKKRQAAKEADKQVLCKINDFVPKYPTELDGAPEQDFTGTLDYKSIMVPVAPSSNHLAPDIISAHTAHSQEQVPPVVSWKHPEYLDETVPADFALEYGYEGHGNSVADSMSGVDTLRSDIDAPLGGTNADWGPQFQGIKELWEPTDV